MKFTAFCSFLAVFSVSDKFVDALPLTDLAQYDCMA